MPQGSLASWRFPFLKIQSGDSSYSGRVVVGYFFNFSNCGGGWLSLFVHEWVSAFGSRVPGFSSFEA